MQPNDFASFLSFSLTLSLSLAFSYSSLSRSSTSPFNTPLRPLLFSGPQVRHSCTSDNAGGWAKLQFKTQHDVAAVRRGGDGSCIFVSLLLPFFFWLSPFCFFSCLSSSSLSRLATTQTKNQGLEKRKNDIENRFYDIPTAPNKQTAMTGPRRRR